MLRGAVVARAGAGSGPTAGAGRLAERLAPDPLRESAARPPPALPGAPWSGRGLGGPSWTGGVLPRGAGALEATAAESPEGRRWAAGAAFSAGAGRPGADRAVGTGGAGEGEEGAEVRGLARTRPTAGSRGRAARSAAVAGVAGRGAGPRRDPAPGTATEPGPRSPGPVPPSAESVPLAGLAVESVATPPDGAGDEAPARPVGPADALAPVVAPLARASVGGAGAGDSPRRAGAGGGAGVARAASWS